MGQGPSTGDVACCVSRAGPDKDTAPYPRQAARVPLLPAASVGQFDSNAVKPFSPREICGAGFCSGRTDESVFRDKPQLPQWPPGSISTAEAFGPQGSEGGEPSSYDATSCLYEECQRSHRRKSFPSDFGDDGGTGGIGSSKATPRKSTRECSVDSFGALVGPYMDADSSNDNCQSSFSRQALFGEKTLRPKLMRLFALEDEAKALEQTRRQLAARFAQGANVLVPPPLEAMDSEAALSEWVRRLLEYEEALQGVVARLVKEACSYALGVTNRPIGLSEIQLHYGKILRAVDRSVQERLDCVQIEHNQLDYEVTEIENLIALCFEKMDEERRGVVTRQDFVDFVCGKIRDENWDPRTQSLSEKDATALFDKMSKGESEMSFELFKEEVSHGCVQVLRDNIDLRRRLLKRYRDYWF